MDDEDKIDKTEIHMTFDDKFGCTIFMICMTLIIIAGIVFEAVS